MYGISSDSPAANKAFAEAQRLPFPLLTDPSGALRKVRGGGRGEGREFVSQEPAGAGTGAQCCVL